MTDRVLSWREIIALAMEELYGGHSYRPGIREFYRRLSAQKETQPRVSGRPAA